jgi:polysaccharide deacetylase family protein (PEP-CTERM system associated)
MKHIFTVDVEDWFNGFPPEYLRASHNPHRLETGMNFLLDILDEAGAKATFFWVGVQAEAYPELLQATAAKGHEIGCHSYEHTPIYLHTPKEFEEDTEKAINTISEITGNSVSCYRAPFFSVRQDTLWALEILASLGITHDSSILPMKHWRTGMPSSNGSIHHIHTPSGTIIEVPIATQKIFGITLPVSGGGYFRVYPYEITKRNIAGCQEKNMPAVFYIHPWEMDLGQPHLPNRGIAELMHYARLKTARKKLTALLHDHSFGPLMKGADEFLRSQESKGEGHRTLLTMDLSSI